MITAATKSGDDTRELAGAVAGLARAGDIVVLAGELGAGKTCFTQGFGRALGVTEAITSPTFTLMRPHDGTALRLLHCDLYRLDHVQEILDLGISEFVDGAAVAVIEWGDLAEPVLPADFLEIRITFDELAGDDGRAFAFRAVGATWANRSAALQRAVERWTTP